MIVKEWRQIEQVIAVVVVVVEFKSEGKARSRLFRLPCWSSQVGMLSRFHADKRKSYKAFQVCTNSMYTHGPGDSSVLPGSAPSLSLCFTKSVCVYVCLYIQSSSAAPTLSPQPRLGLITLLLLLLLQLAISVQNFPSARAPKTLLHTNLQHTHIQNRDPSVYIYAYNIATHTCVCV